MKYNRNKQDAFNEFINVFDCLPFAAIVNKKMFCVHGGISQHLESIDELKQIRRPTKVSGKLLNDLLWSDPFEFNNETNIMKKPSSDGSRQVVIGGKVFKMMGEMSDEKEKERKKQLDSGYDFNFNRSCGCIFNKFALETFLKNHGFQCVIRGHEFTFDGIHFGFENQIITVFSSSYYQGSLSNIGKVLYITKHSVAIVKSYYHTHL